MSAPTPVTHPKRPFAFGSSAGNRLAEDLQAKRIKEVVLPILAVLGGFFLFPLDVAILFTAIVIFGVFICGNGPVNSPLPREKLPFSNKPNERDLRRTPSRDIPSPVPLPSGKETPYPTPATPVQGTPSLPTPGTVSRLAADNMPGLPHMAFSSPQTLSRALSQMRKDSSLETKQPRTPALEGETPARPTTRREVLGTPRNLAEDFREGSHLPSVYEGPFDSVS